MKKHEVLSVKEKQDLISQHNEKRKDSVSAKQSLVNSDSAKQSLVNSDSAKQSLINSDCHIQEDEWRQQAHSLIEQQRKPWDVEGSNLPLRVVANHTSVSWHRMNEITGAPVRITRIGAKNSNGSSDW